MKRAWLPLLAMLMAAAPGLARAYEPTYLDAGTLTDLTEMDTADWHLQVEIELSGDTFPDITTTDPHDGFISGTGTLLTVNAMGARKTGGNSTAELPQLRSVHLLVGGEEHSKEVANPGSNTQSVAMRFTSTHFPHNSLVTTQGWAVFEYQEGLFSIPVDLQARVYNVLGGWYHGDPLYNDTEDLNQRLVGQAILRSLATNIALGFSAGANYAVTGTTIQDLPKATALQYIGMATGLVSATHGNENSLELCDGIDAAIEHMSATEMSSAWNTNLVTPKSHFAIVYSCDTVMGEDPFGSNFSGGMSMRPVGGVYIGFPDTVNTTSAQDPPTYIWNHRAKLMEGLAAGMCARDAVDYANHHVPGFNIAFVGDGLSTLSSVYLTQAERQAITADFKPYPHWFKKL